jgi:hypothetical protein
VPPHRQITINNLHQSHIHNHMCNTQCVAVTLLRQACGSYGAACWPVGGPAATSQLLPVNASTNGPIGAWHQHHRPSSYSCVATTSPPCVLDLCKRSARSSPADTPVNVQGKSCAAVSSASTGSHSAGGYRRSTPVPPLIKEKQQRSSKSGRHRFSTTNTW